MSTNTSSRRNKATVTAVSKRGEQVGVIFFENVSDRNFAFQEIPNVNDET